MLNRHTAVIMLMVVVAQNCFFKPEQEVLQG